MWAPNPSGLELGWWVDMMLVGMSLYEPKGSAVRKRFTFDQRQRQDSPAF